MVASSTFTTWSVANPDISHTRRRHSSGSSTSSTTTAGTWTSGPGREDNEINPDVLGYIFEKYVNQKQMGAYYTKEDITGYIWAQHFHPLPVRRRSKGMPCGFWTGRRRLEAAAGRPRPLHLPRRRPRHNAWNARQPEATRCPLTCPSTCLRMIAAGIS